MGELARASDPQAGLAAYWANPNWTAQTSARRRE
jgi:hypothetical protein